MRDREKGARVRREDGFLIVQIRGADGEDRSLGRGLVAEPPQVSLAERAFPSKGLAADRSGPVTMAVLVFALDDLGQFGDHLGHVVEGRHTFTVLACAPARLERRGAAGTAGKYSNLAAQHRPHTTSAGQRPAPMADIDRRATRSHRGGHGKEQAQD